MSARVIVVAGSGRSGVAASIEVEGERCVQEVIRLAVGVDGRPCPRTTPRRRTFSVEELLPALLRLVPPADDAAEGSLEEYDAPTAVLLDTALRNQDSSLVAQLPGDHRLAEALSYGPVGGLDVILAGPGGRVARRWVLCRFPRGTGWLELRRTITGIRHRRVDRRQIEQQVTEDLTRALSLAVA